MSTHLEYGFLSADINAYIARAHDLRPKELAVNRCLVREAIHAERSLRVSRPSLQQALTVTSYVRTIANAQAVAILCERGMEDQGRVMLRAAMESLFNLRAIACSETTAHRFLEMDELQRNRALGKWERLHSYHSRPEAELRLVEELRKELKETIEKKDIKGLTTEDISRLAGMHDWYLSVYTVLSDAVHSRVRDLERHVVADKEGQIVGFRDEPTFDDLQDLLLSNAEILELAMDSLCQVFPELGPLPSEKHKKELQDLKAIRLAE